MGKIKKRKQPYKRSTKNLWLPHMEHKKGKRANNTVSIDLCETRKKIKTKIQKHERSKSKSNDNPNICQRCNRKNMKSNEKT